MASPVVQLRVPEDMLSEIDDVRGEESRSAWLLRLAGRELSVPSPAADLVALTVVSGELSPGVVCMGAGCWQRNTSRFGLRRLPLCPSCHASLEGRVYETPVPPEAARLLKRGVA